MGHRFAGGAARERFAVRFFSAASPGGAGWNAASAGGRRAPVRAGEVLSFTAGPQPTRMISAAARGKPVFIAPPPFGPEGFDPVESGTPL